MTSQESGSWGDAEKGSGTEVSPIGKPAKSLLQSADGFEAKVGLCAKKLGEIKDLRNHLFGSREQHSSSEVCGYQRGVEMRLEELLNTFSLTFDGARQLLETVNELTSQGEEERIVLESACAQLSGLRTELESIVGELQGIMATVA